MVKVRLSLLFPEKKYQLFPRSRKFSRVRKSFPSLGSLASGALKSISYPSHWTLWRFNAHLRCTMCQARGFLEYESIKPASCLSPAGAHWSWKKDLSTRPGHGVKVEGAPVCPWSAGFPELWSWNKTPTPVFSIYPTLCGLQVLGWEAGRGWGESGEEPTLSVWLSRLENVKLAHIVYFTLLALPAQ